MPRNCRILASAVGWIGVHLGCRILRTRKKDQVFSFDLSHLRYSGKRASGIVYNDKRALIIVYEDPRGCTLGSFVL